MMRKMWKGSAVLEEALLFPVIMLALCTSVWVLFYFHDKSILKAAVYETVQREVLRIRSQETADKTEGDSGRQYLQERTVGKMIFFGSVQAEEEISKNRIILQASARKGFSKVTAYLQTELTEPETYIRNIRKIRGN